MALSDKDIRAGNARLLFSRHRVLNEHPFYGLLLMHMRFSLDEGCETAYTDGERIAFSPAFLRKLSDTELDFVMMHEILHVALAHCERGKEFDPELFNIACDIVVNSNILLAAGMYLPAITLSDYGVAMHEAPDGKEGHLYTAEEVYRMLISSSPPKQPQGNAQGQGNAGAKRQSPSSSSDGGKGRGKGSATSRQKGEEETEAASRGRQTEKGGRDDGGWDDHSHWHGESDDSYEADVWRARVASAAAVLSVNDPQNGCGSLPLGVERLLKERHRSRVDWRTVLHEFVQEEIADWSFSPPDRRFPDSPFFLPDFNGTVERVRNVLFMVDTSGSMSDRMVADAYGEVCAAIEQFGGVLEGQLGFFDAEVVPPVPFSAVEDVLKIRPKGGGGTSFHAVFRYLRAHMEEEPPACMIILTDGYAPFPDEEEAGGVPILWMINNQSVTPPYGRVVRVDGEEK